MLQEISGEVLVGGLVAILTLLVPLVLQFMQARRLRQEHEIHRESHNLRLFEALASDDKQFQLAAAAVLTERLSPPLGRDRFAMSEHRAVIRALLAVTKTNEKASPETEDPDSVLEKFIADQIALNHKVPLKQFDWQNCRLRKAWWPKIRASGVDFWRSDLSKAGMRGAILEKATLAEARLDGAVLKSADLRGANLKNASLIGTKLQGAVLTGATVENAIFRDAVYDEATKFPEGFDPIAAGMKFEPAIGSADRRA